MKRVARLGELIARNLGVSKTAAARWLAAGRVEDEQGLTLHDRKMVIDVERLPLTVQFDGAPIVLFDSAVVLLHKPLGVVTALRDERHPTAYALLRDAPLFPELRPAGRLDLDSSGLLLWCTDGALIQRLTHPKRRVPRTYQAVLARPFLPPPRDLVLADGLRPDLVELRQISIDEVHPALSKADGAQTLATVTIVGGAYHEVRRLFAALGSHVLALCRTRFGLYELPVDLAPGRWRQVCSPP